MKKNWWVLIPENKIQRKVTQLNKNSSDYGDGSVNILTLNIKRKAPRWWWEKNKRRINLKWWKNCRVYPRVFILMGLEWESIRQRHFKRLWWFKIQLIRESGYHLMREKQSKSHKFIQFILRMVMMMIYWFSSFQKASLPSYHLFLSFHFLSLRPNRKKKRIKIFYSF